MCIYTPNSITCTKANFRVIRESELQAYIIYFPSIPKARHGYSFDILNFKCQAILQASIPPQQKPIRCAEGAYGSLCRRNSEEKVCGSHNVPESPFVSRFVAPSRGRIWLQSPHGRPNNSLQWECICWTHFKNGAMSLWHEAWNQIKGQQLSTVLTRFSVYLIKQ